VWILEEEALMRGRLGGSTGGSSVPRDDSLNRNKGVEAEATYRRRPAGRIGAMMAAETGIEACQPQPVRAAGVGDRAAPAPLRRGPRPAGEDTRGAAAGFVLTMLRPLFLRNALQPRAVDLRAVP
jgi:hypothetical protein